MGMGQQNVFLVASHTGKRFVKAGNQFVPVALVNETKMIELLQAWLEISILDVGDPLNGAAELCSRAQKTFASIRHVQASFNLTSEIAIAQVVVPLLAR